MGNMIKVVFSVLVWIVLFNNESQAQSLTVDAGIDRHLCLLLNDVISGNTQLGGDVVVSGGVPPYQYEWSFSYGQGLFNRTASEILDDTTIAHPAMYYFAWGGDLNVPHIKLKVTDSEGNTGIDSVKITYTDFGVKFESWDVYVHLGDSVYLDNGKNIGGGIAPESYKWVPEDYIISPNDQLYFWVKPEEDVNYSMQITDAMGCQVTGDPFYYVRVLPTSIEEPTQGMFNLVKRNGTLTVQLSNFTSPKSIKVLDVKGIEVMSATGGTIDVSFLTKGIYLVSVETKTGDWITQKIAF